MTAMEFAFQSFPEGLDGQRDHVLTRPDVYGFGVYRGNLVKPETTEFGEKGDVQGEGDVIGPLVLQGAPAGEARFGERSVVIEDIFQEILHVVPVPMDNVS